MASVDAATQSMIRNLEEKTGKSLVQWAALARHSGKAGHGEIVAWLKSKHTLGHGYANLVAHTTLRGPPGAEAAEDLVEAQYAGTKAALRPACDALLQAIRAFGKDVEVAPKKTYVSLRRSKQFALIQPSTAARLDVGINLKGVEAAGRLEASGSFNAMVTHRVRIGERGEIDDELIGWLRKAYDAA